MARDGGGDEVALGIALAAQVEVIVPGPKEAAAAKVPLDPPDRMLQHIAHLAGLQMPRGNGARDLGSHGRGADAGVVGFGHWPADQRIDCRLRCPHVPKSGRHSWQLLRL